MKNQIHININEFLRKNNCIIQNKKISAMSDIILHFCKSVKSK